MGEPETDGDGGGSQAIGPSPLERYTAAVRRPSRPIVAAWEERMAKAKAKAVQTGEERSVEPEGLVVELVLVDDLL